MKLPLSNGQTAIVSDRDSWALQYSWSVHRNGCPCRTDRSGRQRTVYLARQITKARPEQRVCYRNGDKLDCRRSNLKLIPHSQREVKRRPNKCGATGVRRSGNNFQAVITNNYRTFCLGTYRTVAEAAKAYQRAKHGL